MLQTNLSEDEIIYMNWIIYIERRMCRYDPRSYEHNFRNCLEKPEKFRTSTGFVAVTSRCRCEALYQLGYEAIDGGS